MFKNSTLKQQKENFWATENQLNTEFSWCCEPKCTTVSNYYIQYGHVSTWDGQVISTNMGNLGGCRPDAGRCTSPDGTVIWNPTGMSDICPFTTRGTYFSKYSKPFVIVHTLQTAFELKEPITITDCPEIGLAQITHQCVVIKFTNNSITKGPALNNITNISQNKKAFIFDQYRNNDIVNCKLNYLTVEISNQEKDNFKNIYTQLCFQSQKQLTMI